jgi:hypothetical protein
MREWAQRCDRLVVAPAGCSRAIDVLEVSRKRLVALPNGVDTDLFAPREVDRAEVWRRVLVEQARGSLADGEAGSARYRDAQVAHLRRPSES